MEKDEELAVLAIRQAKWKRYVLELFKLFPSKISQCVMYHFDLSEVPVLKESLYLHGETGTGKSVMGAAMLLAYMRDLNMKGRYLPNIEAVYIPYSDLFFKIKEAYAKKDHSDIELLKECREADILFLDDIGVKNVTDWVIEILYVIIDHRVSNEKLTILTSNLTLKELSANIKDDRIIRRIEDNFKVALKKHWKNN